MWVRLAYNNVMYDFVNPMKKIFNKQKNTGFIHQNFSKKVSGGFTLIEIMVATSIFMIIMLMAMGALITTSDAAKKAQALRTAMDNVNFALESMTRSLRMGTDYTCVTGGSVSLPAGANNDCPLGSGGGGAIIFTPAGHAQPRDAAFTLTARGDATNTYVLQSCDPSSCLDLVASNIDIQKLTFFVNGSRTDDRIQPSVYIIIKGVVTIKGRATTFAIQTNVSQRNTE